MKREKVIEVHNEIIKRSQQFIEFINKVPMDRMICLVVHDVLAKSWAPHTSGEDIQVICKVIGFNKESIRVDVIASEMLFHPISEIPRTNEHYKQRGMSKVVTASHIKLVSLKDFTWTEVNKKDLPLFIGYEFKTILFDRLLK